jgi:transcription-repair coupling factor (superfamily II helicase)
MFSLPKSFDNICFANLPLDSDGLIISDIFKQQKQDLLYIALNDQHAFALAEKLKFFLPEAEIINIPAWDCLPYDRASPNHNIISERLTNLSKLLHKTKPAIIITTVKAALTRMIPCELVSKNSLTIETGKEISMNELINFLINNSYIRTNTVNEIGEFAVKGSIVDIFTSSSSEPIRIDFFDNIIDNIRYFDPITQISHQKIIQFTLNAASEIILDDEHVKNFRSNYRQIFGAPSNNDLLYTHISEKRQYIGMEHWLPLFYNSTNTLFDYCPDAIIIKSNLFENAVSERRKIIEDYYHTRKNERQNDIIYNPLAPNELYLTSEEITDIISSKQNINFTNFDTGRFTDIDLAIKSIPDFHVLSQSKKQNSVELLKDFLKDFPTQQKIITGFSASGIERLKTILQNHDLESVIIEKWQDVSKLANDHIAIILLPLEKGFASPQYVFISEQDLLGSKTMRRVSKSRKAEKLLMELSSLSADELVVHKEHGIGRFEKLETISVQGRAHDCLKIIYDNDDKLYLPVENINLITRYGAADESTKLDRLGSAAWQERTAKLKKKLREIAADLIKTASARELIKTQEFSPTESLMQEFTAHFKFTETDDQLKAIEDVTEDLSHAKPMDRLICGDVGFGKTEIALRAAFIVVCEHQAQVAIIAPTTLLCRQHYNNFCERFAGFDIKIAQLSRMVTHTQKKEIKTQIEAGKIDIVIGTHALLAKDMKFKNLNLIVIDEEQHFGVTQKEKLKQLKSGLNVLTLSATPIPRTLQMSLAGIRDLSLIATPPVDRMAVRSYIMPSDGVVLREAILREFYRGGRVFYVCPRVKDLDMQEERIRKLVPEIKIIKAHGGMPASQLDKIMTDFCDGVYDLLLSTTIVESGLDIPEANTIIIHRADMFGLAQLYQLRGRVGRSKIRAYAYFTFDAKRRLTANALKRLDVMRTLDGLGAGFSLASYDMDIRGAGNLLGEEQSGHVREVGVELYQQMLKAEINKLRKNKEKKTKSEQEFVPNVNLGISVLIPDDYIADLSVRMEYYRRIADLKNKQEAEEMIDEMIDRFGKIPEQVENLLHIIELKQLCLKANVDKLDVGPKGIVIRFYKNHFEKVDKLMEYVFHNKKIKIRPDQKLVLNDDLTNDDKRLATTKKLLEELLAIEKQNY